MSHEKVFLTCTSKPSSMLQTIFNQNLVVIRNDKMTLLLNKPTYTGMSVLDLSKVLMYEFHYDYINNKYGNN